MHSLSGMLNCGCMKSRPNREPDFTFTTEARRYGRAEKIYHSCYWKEKIVVVQCYDSEEYIYDVVQTEFGRIDMRFDDICECISWIKGLRESYEVFQMEEALLND